MDPQWEARVLEVLGQLQEVREALHTRKDRSVKAGTVCEVVQNATSAILEELQTLRNWQAVAAALSTLQLVLFLTYLVVQVVMYAVKKCKKHRERQVKEEVELIGSGLMQQKSKQWAAASRKMAQETQ